MNTGINIKTFGCNYRRAIIFFLMLIIVSNVSAQQLDSLLGVYDAKVPQEKVYVHFDNTLYVPGQTVWYKAYLLTTGDPAAVSRNFYIDLFDEKGKLLQRVTAPVINSSASGSFTVPAKYPGNHLQVLAYTKWMLNFDSSFLFHHIIPVAQPLISPAGGEPVMPLTTLNFFPEGGDMVAGLKATVAFKALNSGLPAKIKGVIRNNREEAVTGFETMHNGMGKITFMPVAGEMYTAEWKDARGAIQRTRLPQLHSSGISLSLLKNNSKWTFTIERTEKEESLRKVMIVASMSQHVLFRAGVNLSAKTAVTATLPADKFPSGVLRVTVMDMNLKPLAERVVFINNGEYLVNAKVYADTLNTGKRGKNVFEIEMPDTISASLSLAVTDRLYDSSVNIISGLLLSPEIKGSVYEPAYYFLSTEDSVAAQLDLVLMTHGWRRFAWENVTAGTSPSLQYTRDTGFLSVAGKITKLSENRIKKAEQVNMILVAKDSSKQYVFAPLLPDGSFREDNMILFDTVKVYYQLNKSFIPGKSNVSIGNTFLPLDTVKRVAAIDKFLPDTTGMMQVLRMAVEQKRLDSLMLQSTLKEVVVKTRLKSPMQLLDERYASGLFRTLNSKQLSLLDDPTAKSSASIFAYLMAKIAGLSIRDPYGINPSAQFRGKPVAYFIDEMPVTGIELVTVIPADIAYVKLFPPPFIGGGSYVDGQTAALAIYTKHYEDAVMDMKGMDYTLLPGYTPFKEFYSPDPAEKNFNNTDLRRTLYWNPNIIMDTDSKKIKISFYNNDISTGFQIVLEGVADDGRLIHYSKLLK